MQTQLIELAPGTIVLSRDGSRYGEIADRKAVRNATLGNEYCYVFWRKDKNGFDVEPKAVPSHRMNLLLTAYVCQPVTQPRQAPTSSESASPELSALKATPVSHVPSNRRGSLVNVVTGPAGEKNGVVVWHTLSRGEEARAAVPLSELRLEGGWMPPAAPPEPSHIILDYIGRMFDVLPLPETSADPSEPLPETSADSSEPLPVWHEASQRFGKYETENGWRNGKVRVRWEGNMICTAWVPVSELVVVTQDHRYRAPLAEFLPGYAESPQEQPQPQPQPTRTAQASIMDHIAQMFEGLQDANGQPIKVKILKPTTTAAAAAVQTPPAPEPQQQAPVVPGMNLKRGTKRTLGACSFCSCPSTDDNQPMWQLSGDRLRVRSCDGCLSQALQKAREAGLVDEQA